jgi:hypothetical protein
MLEAITAKMIVLWNKNHTRAPSSMHRSRHGQCLTSGLECRLSALYINSGASVGQRDG